MGVNGLGWVWVAWDGCGRHGMGVDDLGLVWWPEMGV